MKSFKAWLWAISIFAFGGFFFGFMQDLGSVLFWNIPHGFAVG